MMNFPAADPSVVFQPPVEVRLATAFRTPPASAIKINLAGGTIKAARTDFSQAAYLNWTTGTLWYTGGTNQTSWIGATNSETLTVPGSGLLKGSTRFNASLAVHGTVAPGDAHETVTFEARNLTIGTTGAGGVRGSSPLTSISTMPQPTCSPSRATSTSPMPG